MSVEQGEHFLLWESPRSRDTLRLKPRIGDGNVGVEARAGGRHGIRRDRLVRPEAIFFPIVPGTAGDRFDQLLACRAIIARAAICSIVRLVHRLARISGIWRTRGAWARV